MDPARNRSHAHAANRALPILGAIFGLIHWVQWLWEPKDNRGEPSDLAHHHQLPAGGS